MFSPGYAKSVTMLTTGDSCGAVPGAQGVVGGFGGCGYVTQSYPVSVILVDMTSYRPVYALRRILSLC